jgi:hypothetical protein
MLKIIHRYVSVLIIIAIAIVVVKKVEPVKQRVKPYYRSIRAELYYYYKLLKYYEVLRKRPAIDNKQWERHTIETKLRYSAMVGFEKGDLNKDGKVDILIHESARRSPHPHDGIYWYEIPANPKMGPWLRRRLSDPEKPIRWGMALAVGDVDNDGDLDVVSLSFENSYVYLCINPLLGSGGEINQPWQTLTIEGTGGILRDGERVELIDMDGDKFLDVVFARGHREIKKVYVLFNPNGVPSNTWIKKEIGSISGSDAHDIYTADLDNDGDLDIINASGDGGGPGRGVGKIFWYEHPDGNPRKGKWTRYPIETSNASWGGLKIKDIDGDGWIDVIASEAHKSPDGKIYWFYNPKSSYTFDWKRCVIGTQGYPHVNVWIDVDKNGEDELWVPDSSFTTSGKWSWRTGGIVYFKKSQDPTQPWTKYRVAEAPEVGRPCLSMDVDGDGDLDIVSGADHADAIASLVWWENKYSHRDNK